MVAVKRRLVYLSQGLVFLGAALSASVSALNEKQCNQRLYNTLYGRPANESEINKADPISAVDSMLTNDAFYENFSRFANAHMNLVPESNRDANPVYNMIKNYIFNRDKQWYELFTAQVDVVGQNVNPKTDAVGYFENRHWKKANAGNEEDGFKLRTAYRILNNAIGLNLEALTVTSDGGSGQNDRKNPDSVCVSCHFNLPFALDKVALILDRVDRRASDAQNTIFAAPLGPFPQTVYGQPISNLKELADMLVEREEFYTNACHVGFKFVFARQETSYESEVFSACIDKFKSTGKIQDTVRHFVKSELFCPGV